MTLILRTVVIGLAISFVLLQPATAIECQEDFVKEVTSDGEILVTRMPNKLNAGFVMPARFYIGIYTSVILEIGRVD